MMRTSNKKNRFKLDPAKTRELEALAKVMPQIPLMDKTGRPTFTLKPERLSGQEVIDRGISKPGDDIDVKRSYTVTHRITNFMNHRVNLFSHYQQHGDQGVKDYTNGINNLYDAMKEARAAMNRENLKKIKTEGGGKIIVNGEEIQADPVKAEDNGLSTVADELLDDNVPTTPETPTAAVDEQPAG